MANKRTGKLKGAQMSVTVCTFRNTRKSLDMMINKKSTHYAYNAFNCCIFPTIAVFAFTVISNVLMPISNHFINFYHMMHMPQMN